MSTITIQTKDGKRVTLNNDRNSKDNNFHEVRDLMLQATNATVSK